MGVCALLRRAATLATALVAVAALLTCISCGKGGDGQASSSPPKAFSLPTANLAKACAAGYTEIPLVPETVEEKWYQDSLRACRKSIPGDRTNYQLQVINGGPAVWVIEHMTWNPDLSIGKPAEAIFRQALRPWHPRYSGRAVEPGEVEFERVPVSYLPSMHLDIALQAAWELASRTVSAVESRLKQKVKKLLGPNLSAGLACAEAGYNIANQLTPLMNSTDPADALDHTYQAAVHVGNCKTAIDEAQEAARKNRLAATITLEDYSLAAKGIDTDVAMSGESLLSALRTQAKILFRAVK